MIGLRDRLAAKSLVRSLAAAAVVGLAACNSGAVADRNTRVPNLNEMVDTQPDWSLLKVLTNRRPAESELLMQSPITGDLNAMMGPKIFGYRKQMAVAGPLLRDGTMLISVTAPGPHAAYLIIEPAEFAIEAGWRESGCWHVERTAGTALRRPRQVEALLVS